MRKSVADKILAQTLTSPATLAKLAARGMFASIPLNMPPDIHNANITICLKGVPIKRGVLECYAPGDETGWAVVYKLEVDGLHTGEVELIYGVWTLHREAPDFSREAQKAKQQFVDVDHVPGGEFDLEEIIKEVSEVCDLGEDEMDASSLLRVMTAQAVDEIPFDASMEDKPGMTKVDMDAKIIASLTAKSSVAEKIVAGEIEVLASNDCADISESDLIKEIEGGAPVLVKDVELPDDPKSYQYPTDAEVEEAVSRNRERVEHKARENEDDA